MFVVDIDGDQSGSLTYIIIFPVFWVIAGIALLILIKVARINILKRWNQLGILLSTPIPYYLLLFIWYKLPMSESPSSTWERDVDGKRLRQIYYSYDNHQYKRIEYYSSVDTVTNKQPFPRTENYVLDSIKYFNQDGSLKKTKTFIVKM